MGSDFESLRDLTYDSRKRFFAKWGQHWPVQTVPVLCFSSKLTDETSPPGLAHRLISIPARYIGYMYGAKSDGAVTESDAELPGTMVVRAKGALSHMSMVLPSPREGLTLSGHKVCVCAHMRACSLVCVRTFIFGLYNIYIHKCPRIHT